MDDYENKITKQFEQIDGITYLSKNRSQMPNIAGELVKRIRQIDRIACRQLVDGYR
jgi:hypothetical protein